jgi:hypothetical protein
MLCVRKLDTDAGGAGNGVDVDLEAGMDFEYHGWFGFEVGEVSEREARRRESKIRSLLDLALSMWRVWRFKRTRFAVPSGRWKVPWNHQPPWLFQRWWFSPAVFWRREMAGNAVWVMGMWWLEFTTSRAWKHKTPGPKDIGAGVGGFR